MENISPENPLLRILEAALTSNDIQVPEGSVERLLNRREWIYPTQRVDALLKKLTELQLYSLFSYQHHLESAIQLFDFIKDQGSSVVYGHKAQGKSQFLFFVFKLLQAMGEKVLFLDRTLLPSKNINKVRVSSSEFCGHLWKDDFLQINDTNVKDALQTFYRDALPASFGEFVEAVLEYTLSSGERIWIVVDEVVLLENFPIDLPEEQAMGPFNWIVTGSAGIGSWVAKKHLAKFVFDLPLFSKDESFKFAFDLS